MPLGEYDEVLQEHKCAKYGVDRSAEAITKKGGTAIIYRGHLSSNPEAGMDHAALAG